MPVGGDYAMLFGLLPCPPSTPTAAPDPIGLCAVVITYHPDPDVPLRLTALAAQVGHVVIVDNASPPAARAVLHELEGERIELIQNPENLGIARALNQGVETALRRGFRWCLLLDQDSAPDTDMAQRLCAILAGLPHRERVALLGCGYRDPADHGADESAAVAPDEPQDTENVITSGSVLSLAAYAIVGPFRDELFIDYVDVDYCRRARAAGLRVLQTRCTLMTHRIGAPSRHRLLWMRKWTTNHAPDRRYYIARNHTALLRESGQYRVPALLLKSLSRCLRTIKRIILYESDKQAKIIAVWQGWWHGMRGVMGPRRGRSASTADGVGKPVRRVDGS